MIHRTASACALAVPAGIGPARVVEFFSVSGRVATSHGGSPVGVRVDLFLDLDRDRDGERHRLETVPVRPSADGTSRAVLAVDPRDVELDDLSDATALASRHRNGGFRALLGDAPPVAVLRFEREGHGSVVCRRLVTSAELTSDAVLAPLTAVGCSDAGCGSADGSR